MIIDTSDKAVIDRVVDHFHHHVLQESEINDHFGLLAGLMQTGTCASDFDGSAMAVDGSAF
jgi:hypothetical protein